MSTANLTSRGYTTNNNNSDSNELICPKHNNSNIQFICAVQNCKQSRKICEICRQRQPHHISYHTNYIFKFKEFFEFNKSKLVIPRLEKGIQDLQAHISKHKQFYKQQIIRITEDFNSLAQKFVETTEKFKKIYLHNFQKEINAFDQDFINLVNNLKIYENQKSHQQNFFTKLFNNTDNDKSANDIEQIINKNSKGFDVRASIIMLKSKLTESKVAKTFYKSTQKQQAKYNQMILYLESFCGTFYNNMNDLLITNNQIAQSTSPEKSHLKSSIISQTKSLSQSRVNQFKYLQNNNNQNNFLRRSMVNEKQLVKTKMPEAHPKVLQIKQYLKSFPNFTQSNNQKQQGPFKYQTGTYLGNYQNGVRSGKGVFIFDDGSYYEGNWQNDNMCGYGRLIKPHSFYEGDIRDGFAHGKGNYQDFEKSYSGEWRNDLRHGIGQQELKNKKRKYVGSFASDKYEGRGKLFDEQFTYQGQFKAGLFDGQGMIKYKNGQILKGSFKQNLRIYGRHTFPDGSYYEGTFRQNMPHGNGDFYWPDGIKYSGQWKNGYQQGLGIQTLANGKQLKGLWQNGAWVKWL